MYRTFFSDRNWPHHGKKWTGSKTTPSSLKEELLILGVVLVEEVGCGGGGGGDCEILRLENISADKNEP